MRGGYLKLIIRDDMKKILTIAIGITALAANAQETYESAQLATQDLNGTAKYIGMGGAMEALGADISTINTNPAGIGLFRRSWIGASAGFTSQSSSFDGASVGADIGDNGKTNVDFNQLGFVWSTKTGNDSRMNFAFNFQKSRNFNQILQAVNSLYDASANKVNYMKNYWYKENLSLQDLVIGAVVGENLKFDPNDEDVYYRGANAYAGKYNNRGWIGNFDFNISGNIHDKVYLGFTLGIKSVHYRSTNVYDEQLTDIDGITDGGIFGFTDERRITGSGIDAKFGAIFRPIEGSPFRFGVYINTPTWYNLDCYGDMSAAADFRTLDEATNTQYDYAYNRNKANAHYDYEYAISTPWRFGASIGHTFGKTVAIGATYEYADYSGIKNRIVEGTYIDYDGFSSKQTSKDYQMDANNDIALRGVSLLKVGAEIKPIPELAVRFGYNWQSAIYKDSGYKDITIDNDPAYGSVGAYYTTYDFVNWKATHRLTFGLGINIGKNWGLDLAYQYSTQKGEYYPFTTTESEVYRNTTTDEYTTDLNYGTGTTVHNNRHQFNMTLGYRF